MNWRVFGGGVRVLVVACLVGAEVVAGFVKYEASGTFSVSSGPDPDGLDGAGFEVLLVIDDAASPVSSTPTSATYAGFVGATLSVLSGPSQGVFPIDTLIVRDDEPFFMIFNFDEIQFRSDSFGASFLNISFDFGEGEWSGLTPGGPVGASPPFLDVGASVDDTFYALQSSSVLVEAVASLDADLQVVKTGVLVGGQVTYSLQVMNNGPFDATGVVVTDALPSGVVFGSDTCGGVNVPPWTWNVGSLADGASGFCDLIVSVDAGVAGVVSNAASVLGDQTDPVAGNNESSVDLFVSPPAGVPVVRFPGLAVLCLSLVGGGYWLVRRG